MRSYTVNPVDEGDKLLAYLKKTMPKAPGSFFHKMLRKKNIVLNGKKCVGTEKLLRNDVISLFLSEETIEKFRNNNDSDINKRNFVKYKIRAVFENKHICIVDKPTGLLTQKAKQDEPSLNELFIDYLVQNGDYNRVDSVFKPSACNRIDKNTSGLVIMAKTKAGAAFISQLIREKKIKKFYRLIVMGEFKEEITIDTQFAKDKNKNKVYISTKPFKNKNDSTSKDTMITTFSPLFSARLSDKVPYWAQGAGGIRVTVMEAQIYTGKPHQIRAQTADMGFPIAGDTKYTTDKGLLRLYREYGIKFQLLRAIRLEFPKLEHEIFDGLEERDFVIAVE